MTTIDNDCMPLLCSRFYCKICDYRTSKKSSFDNHNNSVKHNNNGSSTFNNTNMPELCLSKIYQCQNCQKKFNDRSGLWRHNKKCNNIKNKCEEKNENILDKDLVMMLIKQNTDLMELLKNGTNNTNHSHNNNTTNSHNKAFNLQFFLNETCKDAMNITDFVDSIKLQLSDLEDVGRVGYVEGISNIIIKNLNNLDETKRPVHCTDKKRDTIYVKDQGQWEKEDDNKSKLKRLISKVSSKNSRLLTEYREKYPECKKCESSIADKFNKMIIEAMGGPGENNKEKEEKIIRNISKVVSINKE
jgi:hypothetical protein